MQRKRQAAYRIRDVLVTLVAILAMFSCALGDDAGAVADRIDLRVLYAGNPGSERMQDFERFLNEHFPTVSTTDYQEFQPEMANDYDVVIFDWTSIYPRDANGKVTFDVGGISAPRAPKLDRTFDRPVVMIGAAAGSMSHQLQIAINWKCLCLENYAHDLETKHAIFQGPRAVDLEFHEQEKPVDYYVHPGTNQLGETIKVWKVQEKNFPEIDPGLVSSRENFVETPDAEVISGGINGKGPTSVAIGRHSNYLLWGFSGRPSEMTDSARAAFVNSICYIKTFDGKAPGPVHSIIGGRDSFLEQVYWLRSVSDEYISQQVEKFKKMVAESPLPAKVREKVGDDPAAYFRKMFELHAKQILEKLPANVREQCQDDTEQLIRYYTENLEYLRTDGSSGFAVDDEVRQMGISNRTPALLERCISILENDEAVELAKRVLERYTGKQFESAAEWRQWLDAEGSKLHFDEARGLFVRIDKGE